jgi:hypothetical protein
MIGVLSRRSANVGSDDGDSGTENGRTITNDQVNSFTLSLLESTKCEILTDP